MVKRLSYTYEQWELPVSQYVGLAFDGFPEGFDWIVVDYVPAYVDDLVG